MVGLCFTPSARGLQNSRIASPTSPAAGSAPPRRSTGQSWSICASIPMSAPACS